MREHEVDVVLCERVKGRSLRQHPADLLVVTLDVRLLLRVVRVAEEHPRAPLELRRVVLGVDAEELNHLRVGELASVVGEDDGEQRPEELEPRDVLQHVEDARAGLRGPRVPDEREHEAARELHREEDPAPDGSDDGVELDGLDPEVQGEEREVVLVGAVDAALRVGLRHREVLPRPPFPAAAGLDEIRAPDAEEARVREPVDGALAEAVELRGVRAHHHGDGLPARLHGDGERGAHVGAFGVGDLRPAARLREGPAVVRLRGVGDVVALSERAARLPVAPVADVGGVAEVGAGPLPEVLAHLEAPPLALERDPPPVRVAVDLRAGLEVLADGVRASVVPVAPAHAVLDLVRDRRDRASVHRRQLGECQSAFEPVGDAFPRVERHMLCHDVIPFVLVCRRLRNRTPGSAQCRSVYCPNSRRRAGSRPGHVKIDPRCGSDLGASRSVVDLPERGDS